MQELPGAGSWELVVDDALSGEARRRRGLLGEGKSDLRYRTAAARFTFDNSQALCGGAYNRRNTGKVTLAVDVLGVDAVLSIVVSGEGF